MSREQESTVLDHWVGERVEVTCSHTGTTRKGFLEKRGGWYFVGEYHVTDTDHVRVL